VLCVYVRILKIRDCKRSKYTQRVHSTWFSLKKRIYIFLLSNGDDDNRIWVISEITRRKYAGIYQMIKKKER